MKNWSNSLFQLLFWLFSCFYFFGTEFCYVHSLTWNRNIALSSYMLVLRVCPIIFGLISNFWQKQNKTKQGQEELSSNMWTLSKLRTLVNPRFLCYLDRSRTSRTCHRANTHAMAHHPWGNKVQCPKRKSWQIHGRQQFEDKEQMKNIYALYN